MENTVTVMKSTLGGTNSRLDEAEDQISDLEDKVAENTQSVGQQEKKIPPHEHNLRGLWDNIKHAHIYIIGVPEEERVQEVENLFEEILKENFPILAKENRHTSPGSAESPKQDEPKEAHTKTHHN